MPRKRLYKDKDTIQMVIGKDEKAAFDAWCAANSTTMSEVIRRAITPYIQKGQEILQESVAS